MLEKTINEIIENLENEFQGNLCWAKSYKVKTQQENGIVL